MKCIVFWEFCPEDTDEVIAKSVEARKIREQDPKRFGTILFSPHYMGFCKGFTILESTQEQFINTQVIHFPEVRMKCVPIEDVSKWTEEYMKTKK